MLVLTPNANNTITVTWYQRAGAGDRYQLLMRHLATNTVTTITLLKSTNASTYRQRFDRFTFALGSVPTGQFQYTVYDTNSTAAASTQIVETGLGIVTQTGTTLLAYTGSQSYVTYNGSGIFDPTFDPTFN